MPPPSGVRKIFTPPTPGAGEDLLPVVGRLPPKAWLSKEPEVACPETLVVLGVVAGDSAPPQLPPRQAPPLSRWGTGFGTRCSPALPGVSAVSAEDAGSRRSVTVVHRSPPEKRCLWARRRPPRPRR